MPDEIFHNRPGDNPAPNPYVSTEAELVNRSNLENQQRLERLSSEVQRLRRRLGWISGLSVVALALSGVLAGFMFNMKLQQDQQQQLVGTLVSDKAGVQSQINLLEQQVTSLNQQVTSINQQIPKDLSGQLKATQAQLKQLQAIIQEINSKAVTREQLNATLRRIQQNLNNSGQAPTPLISPTPSNAPSQTQ